MPRRRSSSVDLVGGLVACLALWSRRRWPLGIALAIAAVRARSRRRRRSPALIALFTRRRAPAAPRWSLRVGALAVVHHADLRSRSTRTTTRRTVRRRPGRRAGIVAVVAWGMFVRARRQLVLSLRDRAERAEAEQQLRVEQARQQERARIAREMHDVLAHRISLLSLHAGALEFRPDAPPEEVARAAGVIRASAHQALEDLREVIGVLRDEPGDGDARAPAADARRPARADRGVARGGHAGAPTTGGSTGAGRSRRRPAATRTGSCRRGSPTRASTRAASAVDVTVDGAAGDRPDDRDPQPAAGRRAAARRHPRRRAPASSAWPSGRAWPAAGSSTAARDAGDYRLWAWLPWPTVIRVLIVDDDALVRAGPVDDARRAPTTSAWSARRPTAPRSPPRSTPTRPTSC